MNRVFRFLGVAMLLSAPAIADDTAPAAAAASSDGAAAVCNKLVEAAKKADFEAVQKLTHGKQPKKAKKGFEKMHQEYMARLKDLSCGAELASDDHAVVLAESGGKKRLVPFIKDTAGWLFDAKAYMTMYPPHHGHGKKPH